MKVNLNIDPDLRLGDPGKIVLSLFHEQSGHVLAEKEFDLYDLLTDYISAKALALPGSDEMHMYIPTSARSNVASVVEGLSDVAQDARAMYYELTEHNIQNIASARAL